METEKNAFKVGVVTVISATAAFVILIWLSRSVGGEMQPLTIRFKCDPAMPTIVTGSAVQIGGQKVGRVLNAHLAPADPSTTTREKEPTFYVIIDAELKAFIQLRKDCQVFAEGPPLGGDGVIKIDAGHDPEPLPPGQIVDGAPPGGFGAILASLQSEFNGDDPTSLLGQLKVQLDPAVTNSLMAKLGKSMDDLNSVTASVRNEFDADRRAALMAKLHEIMNNVNASTASLRAEFNSESPDVVMGKIHNMLDTLNDGIASVARIMNDNEKPIGNTIQHVESTAEKLDLRIAENIARQTDPEYVDGLMAKLNSASRELNSALKDIHVVTGKTREIMVLNRDNINKILMNFKETSDHLKSAVKYVLERPWRLLNPPSESENKQQAILDAARNFSDAATRMDDATAQLRALAELHNGRIPSDNPDLVRIQEGLKSTYEDFSKAEDALWRQMGVK